MVVLPPKRHVIHQRRTRKYTVGEIKLAARNIG